MSENDVMAAIKEAAAGASKVHELMENASEKLGKAGMNESELQEVLKNVTAFGKASNVLSFAAGGMELVLKLLGEGGPSPEERERQKIINMISDLSANVDRLSKRLENEFERLIAHDDRAKARGRMVPYISTIDDFKTDIQNYHVAAVACESGGGGGPREDGGHLVETGRVKTLQSRKTHGAATDERPRR